jgi:hypothetical protein
MGRILHRSYSDVACSVTVSGLRIQRLLLVLCDAFSRISSFVGYVKELLEETILEFSAYTVSAHIRDNLGSIFLRVFCFRYCEPCKDGTQLGHYN